MNAEVSQQIALVAYGNAFLSGAITSTGLDFFHPALTGVSDLAFAGVGDQTFTRTVDGWLGQLKDAGVQRLEMMVFTHATEGEAAFHDAGLANANYKRIVARGQGNNMMWQSRWLLVPQETGHNTWSVQYGSVPLKDDLPLRPSADIHLCLDALVNALQGCLTFAKNNGLDDWAKFFHDAATFEPDEKSVCLPDTGFDIDAHHLIRMGQRAWCFGGMGSWNDQSLSDPLVAADYERVSESLFRVLLIASEAAANGYKD